tara:strand:- start:5967 stop:6215 length:249 start_codon:yes stop_codon:yes gene_type:complete
MDVDMNKIKVCERLNKDCGCPEEDWIMNGIYITIHAEPEGQGTMIADFGEWEEEQLVEASGLEDLRQLAETWTLTFHAGNEL